MFEIHSFAFIWEQYLTERKHPQTGTMGPPPPPPGAGVEVMTPFEMERLERIKKNQERMKHLDLGGAMAQVAEHQEKKKPPTKRGLSGGKKRKESLPPRRSSRLKGELCDGNEIVSEKSGQIVVGVHGGPTSLLSHAGSGGMEVQPQERHEKTDVPFTSLNANPEEDAKMLEILSKNRRQGAVSAPREKGRRTKECELEEKDVAKVTKSSTTHLAFMPRGDNLILAAADKRGSVGLWRVDEHDEEYDGVLSFTPHSQYISGLAWDADASLVTASYDGSVRKLDVEKSCFAYAWGDEEMEYSAMSVSSNGTVLLLGNNQGELDRIDIRDSSCRIGKPTEIHARKVNTVHVDPCADHLVATSSTDSTIAIWDMRTFGTKSSKPVCVGSHRQTCQSAYFAPDGSQRLVTTSFDNTIRVWDGKKSAKELVQCTSIRHDNQTGRWVLPLRAIWSPDASSIIVGNMKRFVDIFDASSGTLLKQISSEFMSAIPARNCAISSYIASATASGRIHVWRHAL